MRIRLLNDLGSPFHLPCKFWSHLGSAAAVTHFDTRHNSESARHHMVVLSCRVVFTYNALAAQLVLIADWPVLLVFWH
jgi:hypothetical protein